MTIKICDFETDPFKEEREESYNLKARFMCAVDFETNITETIDIKNVENWILSQCERDSKNVLFFHNLKFDAHFFITALKSKYELDIISAGGLVMQISAFKRFGSKVNKNGSIGQRFTFLKIKDSFSLLRSGVKELGLNLNFEKGEVDYSEVNIKNQKSVDYCIRDCQIVIKTLQKMLNFIEKNFEIKIPINKLPLSIASLTKKVYLEYFAKELHISVKELKYLLYCDNYTNKTLRPRFFGGRVEVFDLGLKRNVKKHDYCSAYPGIMIESFPLPPYKHFKFVERGGLDELYNSAPYGQGFAFGAICEIDESSMRIPIFPERLEDGSVIYRACKKECFLFREEIDYAESLGLPVFKLELWFCYARMKIFKSYIEKCYSERKTEPDLSFKKFYKLFMNCLFGKFAETEEKEDTKVVFEKTMNDALEKVREENGGTFPEGFMNPYSSIDISSAYFHGTKNVEVDANIVIAMFITAMQRMKIHKDLMKCDNPSYCDTDCIVCDNLIENSNELGHLKLESEPEIFLALGQKEYFERDNSIDKIKMKSFTIKEERKSMKEYLELYLKPSKAWRMAGIKECMRRKIPFGTILVYYKEKSGVYFKRWINADMSTRALTKKDKLENVKYHNSVVIINYIRKLNDELKLGLVIDEFYEIVKAEKKKTKKKDKKTSKPMNLALQLIQIKKQLSIDGFEIELGIEDLDKKLYLDENLEIIKNRSKNAIFDR